MQLRGDSVSCLGAAALLGWERGWFKRQKQLGWATYMQALFTALSSLWHMVGPCVCWLHVQVPHSPCWLSLNQNLKHFLSLRYRPGQDLKSSPILISWFKGRIIYTHTPGQCLSDLLLWISSSRDSTVSLFQWLAVCAAGNVFLS